MRPRADFFVHLALLLPLAATACSDSTAPPVGPPSKLQSMGGNQQDAGVGVTLPDPLVVVVFDARGNALAGVTVRWTVSSGQGSVEPDRSVTDANGLAETQWTLGTVAGKQEVVATVEDAGDMSFTAEARAGPPAKIEAVSGDEQDGQLGSPLPNPLVARVTDTYGNGASGVQVVWAVQAGDGFLDDSSSVSDGEGNVRASWTLGQVIGEQRVLATIGTASRSFTARVSDPGFNIFIESVHLNQGTQTPDGSVGGIARRPGLLRIVVRGTKVNSYTPDVLVQLYAGSGGPIRETVVSAPRTGVPTNPDMATITDTWNVTLTAEEMVPGLSAVASLDPSAAIPVATRADNRFPRGEGVASFDVAALPPFNILFIPIRLTSANMTGVINDGNLEDMLRPTRQWIPSGVISVRIRDALTSDRDLTQSSEWSGLLSDLQAVRTAEGATDEYYHGIVPTVEGSRNGGIAYVPSTPSSRFRSALSSDSQPRAGEVIAHELGHNLGRRHAPCGNPSVVDPQFPYLDGGIGPMGYDILSGELRDTGAHKDYMSYCRPSWTSDYTYQGILQWRRQDSLATIATEAMGAAVTGATGAARATGATDPTLAAGAARAAGATGPRRVTGATRAMGARASADPRRGASTTGLLLWGTISSSGVTLNPAFSLVAPVKLPDEATGPYSLRGIAVDGTDIFRLAFRGARVAHSVDPEEAHFAYFVPLGAADIERVERIELSGPRGRSVREAWRRAGVANPAQAEVRLEPAPGGQMRLRWQADRYPAALVRDAATGSILSIVRSGDVRFPGESWRPEQVEVLLSDGVGSIRGRAQ